MKKTAPTLPTTALSEPVPLVAQMQTNKTLYANVGQDFQIGTLDSFPGSDGFDYYVFGTIPTHGGEASIRLAIRMWCRLASPACLEFRIRAGNAVNDKGQTVALTPDDLKQAFASEKLWTSVPKPGDQHRSVTGSFDTNTPGFKCQEIANFLANHGEFPLLYEAIQRTFPQATLMPLEQFIQMMGRLVLNSLSHVTVPSEKAIACVTHWGMAVKTVHGEPKILETAFPSAKPDKSDKPAKASKSSLYSDIGL